MPKMKPPRGKPRAIRRPLSFPPLPDPGRGQGEGVREDSPSERLREHRNLILDRWTAEASRRSPQHRPPAPPVLGEEGRLLDVLVECLATGRYHSAQTLAQELAARDVFRGFGAKQAIDRLLILRDVCAEFLVETMPDPAGARAALDDYEPAVNRILTIVAMAFVQEREKAVGQSREQLGALVEAGMVLAAERSLESVLQRIVDVASRLLQARYGALGVFEASGRLEHFVVTGLSAEEKARIGSLPVGRGLLGVPVREAKPVRLRDISQDSRASGFPPHHPPMRSFLGVPIMSRGRVFGNLYVTEKRTADEFSHEDEQLAVTLAAQAAIAIENASLYEELQRSYDELKQSQDLLVRQEKLASLGRLAAGVAHELNNPLASVAGFAEALQRRMAGGLPSGCPASGDCLEYLTMIQAEVARAAAIVRRLLDFARWRKPTFGPVDLARVISDAIAFVGRQASLSNRQIEVAPFAEAWTVLGDLQMLQQVFLNLLTNALDAIEGGGEIIISAQRGEMGQLVNRSIGQSAAWVEVAVADTGCGIAPEDLSKIFDPFFTTKEVGKGTGLGLAICQSIVEQHGGRIEVKSPGPGQGATVTVRLPLMAEGTGLPVP